ncbi:branched-chain amino acid ABC transporter permease [Thermus sp.]|uniref:branched-chain amino acid ABC transporter permease n=1 Tax=Thermus sp. TaxID=275 RepID=UPI0025D687A6|nr:branched-chain amino acid ABC transporter permease [Thermus sp.]MCS6867881.1 branched-chain amino acid ABC transporter permease [Thermus sp.]MDW8358455.1 branched-chain amino acid ABC transporter permease [Thermus sp.]
MEFYLLVALNGLAYAALLFLLASGLSLVYGVGRILHLAHGGFYMLGGYLGYSLVRHLDFWGAFLVVPLVGVAFGLVAERLVRLVYGPGRALEQVLFTFGLAFVIADLTRSIWGAQVLGISPPAFLNRPLFLGPLAYPAYPLFLIGVGALVALGLWALLRFTPFGLQVRAAAGHPRMAEALGVDAKAVLQRTYLLGVALAALAGFLGAPRIALAPGLDFAMLILGLMVVVLGGLGSISGALYGALMVGLADSFGKAFVPQYSLALIFLVMAAVLVFRPEGLVGGGR